MVLLVFFGNITMDEDNERKKPMRIGKRRSIINLRRRHGQNEDFAEHSGHDKYYNVDEDDEANTDLTEEELQLSLMSNVNGLIIMLFGRWSFSRRINGGEL